MPETKPKQSKKLIVWLVIGLLLLVGGLTAAYFLFWKKSDDPADATPLGQDQIAEESDLIVVYGDSRTGHEDHQRIVDQIVKADPDVVFHTGDLVEDGTVAKDWQKFDEITAGLLSEVDFYPALGNHEKSSDLYFDHFDLPNNERWYTVKLNGMYAIILDSTSELSQGSEQYEWLKAELEKLNDSDFVISIFHHPPYSTGRHNADEMHLRDSIIPLFEDHDVDIVFSGHDHCYERSYVNGIYYIVAGGGGAPLYDQRRESEYSQKFLQEYHFCILEEVEGGYKMTVVDEDGETIDEAVVLE